MRLLALALILAFSATAYAADPCLKCHEEKTPAVVAIWRASAHFGASVGCADCHGTDREAAHAGRAKVDSAKCGACHEKQLASQGLGKHAMGLRSGRGCTRRSPETPAQKRSCALCHKAGTDVPYVETSCAMFLAQSPEMQRQGCGACHRVETGCDACHTKHSTDLRTASDPRTCGICHMGPDHPQYEAWSASVHGVLYAAKTPGAEAPTCVTCHMAGGSHNVSEGIATGRETCAAERETMLKRCETCHAGSFARRSLEDADKIALQGQGLVNEAHDIVAALAAEGLLVPSPADRPPHPLEGKSLVLGPQMIYENLSGAEALYFRLARFYYPTMFKSAFHQSPDYAHWYGNAMLKLTLSELKSEAASLRETAKLARRIDNLSGPLGTAPSADGLRAELRALKDRFLRGDITERDYKRRVSELLDRHGY